MQREDFEVGPGRREDGRALGATECSRDGAEVGVVWHARGALEHVCIGCDVMTGWRLTLKLSCEPGEITT